MLDRFRRLLGADADTSPSAAADTLPVIDHHEARRAQTEGALLLDVREPDEWVAGHIAGARLYPLPRLASDPQIDEALSRPIVAYCKVGARAERAAEILEACGYENVAIMQGGYADWQAAGYPVESGR